MGYGEETSNAEGARVGWFLAGAVAIALAVGAFLYADGHFDDPNADNADASGLTIEVPKVDLD